MAAADGIPEVDALAQDDGEGGAGNRRLLAVIALVAIIFLLLWLFLSQTANVPDVVGMDSADAKVAIVEAGFVVGDIETIDSSAPAGEVTAQAPAGGARALKGAQIDITVANGTGGDDSGGGTDSGEDLGGDSDFDFGANATDTPDMGDGSSGAAIEYGPQVPQVLGMSESKAISTLKSAGYYPVVAGRGPSSTTVAAGLVYYQNPAPEAFEPRGKTVNIWISTGAPSGGKPYPAPE